MITLEQQLCTDAFIAYCYQGGKYNPQDLFKPIVLKEIATLSRKYFKVSDIANEVKKSLGKKVPNILITKELSKLVADGTISYDKEHQTYVTEEDLSEIKDKHNYALNETTYFLQILRDYIKEHSLEYTNITVEDVMDYFESYCMSNLVEIIKFLGGIYTKKLKEIDKDCLQGLISNFIDIKVKTDDRLKNTFENIFNGFHLRKIQEICADKIKNNSYSLSNKIIYLDTNILIRILGYQSEELNNLGEELIQILKEYNYELKVFNETIGELYYLLRGYQINYNKLVEGKNISHIYQTLKDMKIEPYEIPSIISNIPAKLEEKGITIDHDENFFPYDISAFETNVDELAKKKYQKHCDEEIEEFDENDNSESIKRFSKSAKHDLVCIEKIKRLRRDGLVARFEDAKYYFVTADQTLINFNKHYTSAHIAESISDYSISFLLYFYKPDTLKGVSLNSFIASNYNNSDLSISNWMGYVKSVFAKFQAKQLDERQFAYLLTDKIVTNETFANNTVDEIINQNLRDYHSIDDENNALKLELQLEKQSNQKERENYRNTLQSQKMKADDTINSLKSQNDKKDRTIQNLQNQNENTNRKISNLTKTNSQLNKTIDRKENENATLEERVSSLERTLKIFMHLVFSVFIFFGIYLFCIASRTLGSFVSAISLILEVINVMDSVFKLNIIRKIIKD